MSSLANGLAAAHVPRRYRALPEELSSHLWEADLPETLSSTSAAK